jgi:heme/copper-type cytochrome/quinol oxidase subunit 2
MLLILWLLTLGTLDDIQKQIRWNGLTPDQRAKERARERHIDRILWCLVLIGVVVLVVMIGLARCGIL